MFIYGVPITVMGCGRNINGRYVCSTKLPCVCGLCQYEISGQENAWIFPCCAEEKRYIHGIKIGSLKKENLEYKFDISNINSKYIGTAYYISSTGKKYEISDINKCATFDPDLFSNQKTGPIMRSKVKRWNKIKGNITETPQVYLLLDDCTHCV